MLFHVVDSLYSRCRRVIVTSNWSLDELWEHVDYAVMSRLTQMCRPIVLQAHDHRIPT